MALKAGRVGVAKDQVDEFGHITGGGTPENVYTKSQCDNKFELKSHIGGLKFRDNDGTAQYQLPNGEWTNFSSGGAFESIWHDDTPPDPAVHFYPQTISLDLSDVNEIIIKTRATQYSSSSFVYEYAYFNLAEISDYSGECYVYSGVSNNVFSRKITITSSGITFDACRYNGATGEHNYGCVPVEILVR